jgi:hypothetical protein
MRAVADLNPAAALPRRSVSMSKPSRTDSLVSFLTLTLVGGYIAVEMLYFAHSVSMAAGLPIGLGLVWLFSGVLAPSEWKKPPGRNRTALPTRRGCSDQIERSADVIRETKSRRIVCAADRLEKDMLDSRS